MITIVLKDGTVYINDHHVKGNFKDINDIMDCINKYGYYILTLRDKSVVKILKEEVNEIAYE